MFVFCSAIALLAASTHAMLPNPSLATLPIAYFGGTTAPRGAANIAMLAKQRMVIIEKWGERCAGPFPTRCNAERRC
jgi:hypothetical protein